MVINFTIADGPGQLRTHRIMDLCDYLTTKVLEPMFVTNGMTWDRRFMDFITFEDTREAFEPTGTIKFSVPPLFAGQVGALEEAIGGELARLGIKTGPYTYERQMVGSGVPIIRIPIIENPTESVAPPEVNMSYTRGCLVLRDVLGYQKVNGRYEFAADDLLKRVSSVTNDKIASCTTSPVRDRQTQEGVRRTPSAVSMRSIARCLDEIRQFALWAVKHNYRRLAAV